MYSTHSPFLINIMNPENTFIVRNQASDSDSLKKTCINLYKLEEYNQNNNGFDDVSLQPVINSIGLHLINKDENNNHLSMNDTVTRLKEFTSLEKWGERAGNLTKIFTFLEMIYKHLPIK